MAATSYTSRCRNRWSIAYDELNGKWSIHLRYRHVVDWLISYHSLTVAVNFLLKQRGYLYTIKKKNLHRGNYCALLHTLIPLINLNRITILTSYYKSVGIWKYRTSNSRLNSIPVSSDRSTSLIQFQVVWGKTILYTIVGIR